MLRNADLNGLFEGCPNDLFFCDDDDFYPNLKNLRKSVRSAVAVAEDICVICVPFLSHRKLF